MHQNREIRAVRIGSPQCWLRRCGYQDCQAGFHFVTCCKMGSPHRIAPEVLCCGQEGAYDGREKSSGFTVIEILIVVVILVIAAMTVIPLVGSASSTQIRSAANMIAADLEYAKSMAISRQKIYAVVFDESTESYQIEDPNGIIDHPVKKGFQYLVNFSSDSRLSKVDIADVAFNATNAIKFDYLGSPYDGSDSPLNSGVVTLQADGTTITINVEPVTGYVSISD